MDARLAGRVGLLRFLLLGEQPRFWTDALRRRMLAGADLLAWLLACLGLAALSGPATGAWATVCAPLCLLLAKLLGLYDRDHRALRHLTIDELPVLGLWSAATTAVAVLVLRSAPTGGIDLVAAVALWSIAATAAAFWRSLARWLWRRSTPAERAIIVGHGALAEATRRKLELFPDVHVSVVSEQELSGDVLLRGAGRLAGVRRIVVASDLLDGTLLADVVSLCRDEQIKLSVVPPMSGTFGTAGRLNYIADLPVVEYNTWDVSRSTLLLKRVFDLAISVLLLVLLSPLIAVIAVAVRFEDGGPAFFVQRRAGLDGRAFRMFKFRTMVVDAVERLAEVVSVDDLADPVFKLENDPRVTRIGRLLRRTSLDELPQLLNVARGEMSLVGPRPEQVELVERYRPEHLFRLAVKPGLTGPMQVYGRGALSFDERLAVERDYIENLSLGRDLRILALTLTAVVGGRGAY